MTRILIVWLMLLVFSVHGSAQNFQIDIAQFDSWIFSGVGNANTAPQILDGRVQMEIDRIGFSTPLREPQIAKLRFAAKGDIKRFYDDVDEARREFHAFQERGDVGQENVNELYQLASPLAQRLNQGLFGKDSLFQKVARNSVDQNQAEQLRAREERQHKLKCDVAIHAFIATLGWRVPMMHSQREALTDLMKANVTLSDPGNPSVHYLLLYEISELPQAELKAIFDEAQYKALEKNFAQGIMMKPNLKQMGLLDEE